MTSKEQDEETFSTASAESGCLLAASFFFFQAQLELSLEEISIVS